MNSATFCKANPPLIVAVRICDFPAGRHTHKTATRFPLQVFLYGGKGKPVRWGILQDVCHRPVPMPRIMVIRIFYGAHAHLDNVWKSDRNVSTFFPHWFT